MKVYVSNLVYILNKVSLKHYYHYWLDSCVWVLAFLISFFRSSISLACLLQLLSPTILLLSLIPSRHLIFGLPIHLFPSGLAKSNLFATGSSFIRVTYPVNFNLFILALLTTSVSYTVYIAEFCLHLPFSCISSNTQGRVLSNKQGDFSSFL